jgi:8-oxo-dGTP pyrophosphatase MutT (NUDIX family)
MLDLDPARDGPKPREAATLVLVREREEAAVEIFCVERNKQSRFLGGAIVFPGGRVEDSDKADTWKELVNDPESSLRAYGVAACRETLEEAALLVASGPVDDADVVALRTKADTLAVFLRERGLTLDLRSLVPLARWITPKVEPRRFDTQFFVAEAPPGQRGAHDMSETMASFWDSPAHILERFERTEIQLAPPTHRTLMQLAGCKSVADAIAVARAATLDPICPELVQQGDTLALTLPGDPQHSVREPRIMGPSRYVLHGTHWRAEAAP